MVQSKELEPGALADVLWQERLTQVKTDIDTWAAKNYGASDCDNSVIYSILELGLSFAKRADDIIKSIDSLLAADRIVPGVILARALVETTAIGCLYLEEINRQIRLKNFPKLEKEFLRFYAGSTRADATYKAVHVNDGLRFLEKADVAYVEYLVGKYPDLWGHLPFDPVAAFSGPVSVRRTYDDLSEVSHPNGVGTQYLYPSPDAPDASAVRERYRFLCGASIWQAHHLLRALPSTGDLQVRFKAAFPAVNSFSEALVEAKDLGR